MKDASICGLGQTAYAAIESAIHRVGVFNGTRQWQQRMTARRSRTARSTATPDDRDRPVAAHVDAHGRAARSTDSRSRCPKARRFSTPAAQIGIEIPTLCFLDTLHPVNACRVCVVEVEGARVLVPSCSRAVEDGHGRAHRTRSACKHSRKLVLELLASSVDLSTTPDVAEWIDEYDAKPERFGPPAPPAPAGTRDAVDPRPPRAAGSRRSPRRSPSRRRSTTICTCATTRSAFSATSASRRAGRIIRTRSRSPSPAAGSTRTSRPSSPFRCRSRRASTAATASRCVPPAR